MWGSLEGVACYTHICAGVNSEIVLYFSLIGTVLFFTFITKVSPWQPAVTGGIVVDRHAPLLSVPPG